MPSLSKIFGGSSISSSARASQQSLSAAEEPKHLESALHAAISLLNDDVQGAETELRKGDSVYHKLGLGLVMFMRATLGFEREIMHEASTRLATAETAAADGQRHALKDRDVFHSDIYPLGMEYTLCLTEAQIMGAVVGVLTESLTEALKGFYKIRKSIFALESIAEAEKTFLSKTNAASSQVSRASSLRGSPSRPSTPRRDNKIVGQRLGAVDFPTSGAADGEDVFVDAEDSSTAGSTQNYRGHLETDGAIKDTSGMKLDPPAGDEEHEEGLEYELEDTPSTLSVIDPSFLKNPIDQFIHSGYCLHHGMLLLMLSLIPPAFSRILSIIGFRGNREKGLSLLWEATRIPIEEAISEPPTSNPESAAGHPVGGQINAATAHAAMAGLIVLGYYSGLVSTLDILPSSSHPRARCTSLLKQMRARFPKSKLWLLEESRMAASDRDLFSAIRILEAADETSQLKQIEALRWFEHGLDSMYTHQYEKCANSFLKCIGLNDWSHALYYYIAGSAHIELYRRAKYSTTAPDADAAERHAHRAEELLAQAPEHAGKKKLLARQLPFDAFVAKKLGKWRKRADEHGLRLADAVGVSPIEEIIFFWGGYKKMDASLLRESLERLWWSDGGARDVASTTTDAVRPPRDIAPDPHADGHGTDDHAVLALLRGTIYRHLGDTGAARTLLKREIVDAHGWAAFKGMFKDNWPAPIARYEMAVCAWEESLDREGRTVDEETRREKLAECSRFLEEAAAWESYDLEARMGIKITTGRDTLRGMGVGP